MSTLEIINRWCAELYDQEETEVSDINLMLSLIGEDSKNILEVCCGSGRILVPLAKAGHIVKGIDMDETMLQRIPQKAEGLRNIEFSKADAIDEDWGNDHDVVILGCNLLINIVSDMNYEEAQKLFIKKAYNCLKTKGRLFLDFNCFQHPEKVFENTDERIIFEGTDSFGNYGKMTLSDSKYDLDTHITTFRRKIELTTAQGKKMIRETLGLKHIPTLPQVHQWLKEVGFSIVEEYKDTDRVTIWAEKKDQQ